VCVHGSDRNTIGFFFGRPLFVVSLFHDLHHAGGGGGGRGGCGVARFPNVAGDDCDCDCESW
jgi:hypothetical protein